MKRTLPLVLVEWEDAFNGNHDWFRLDTLPDAVEPLIVQTTGFLVQSNRERITLAQSFSDTSACNLWTIPRAMVRSLTKIRAVSVERGDD